MRTQGERTPQGRSGDARRLATLAVLMAFLAAPAAARAAATPGLTGWVSDTNALPGVTSTAIAGHYAYAPSYYGGVVAAVDLSNPSQPVIAGTSEYSGSLVNADTINIANGYAYVVSKNRNASSTNNDDGTGNSLTILDISSNPAHPAVVGTLTDRVNLFGAYGVAVQGNYAYIAAQGCLSGQPCPNPNVGDAFVVVDVSNPSAPSIVSVIKNNALTGAYAGALKHPTAVAIDGHYAYVTAAYTNRLTVIDISNPAAPTIVSSLVDSSQLKLDVDVAVQNGYAYVADQASGLGRVAVVDVHDPTHPSIVSTVTSSTWLNGAYRIRVRGNYAYVAAVYAAAVSVIDISNPLAPRFLGGYQSSAVLNRATGIDLDGAGAYLVGVSPYLSTETQPLYPPYPFQPGGSVLTGTLSLVQLDPTPLTVAIQPSSKPPNPTTQTTANFVFSVSDVVSTVSCTLDSGPPGPCSSPTSQSYTGLAAGSHVFTVAATDPAGLTATDTYSWTQAAAPPPPPATGPTTPVLDNFNRANGPAGSNWGAVYGGFTTLSVASNQAVDPSSSTYSWAYWTPQTFGPDSEAYATIATTSSDAVRICARFTSPTTSNRSGYCVHEGAGSWSIRRIDRGTATTLGPTVTQAVAPGDRVGIVVVGSTIQAWYAPAGGSWTLLLSQSDATYSGAGYLAVETRGAHLDDFGGGTSGQATVPQNTTAPSITGQTIVGQTLTATAGSWTGNPAPTYTYQWQDCDGSGSNCADIGGATGSSYQTTSGDVGSIVQVVVTATNSAGAATATSNQLGPIAEPPAPPQNVTAPEITGQPVLGQTLSADPGAWTGTPIPTYAYQWQDCDGTGANCTNIAGATGPAYQTAPGDLGAVIQVVVTATNTVGSATATSNQLGPVGQPATAPQNTTPPAISGQTVQGQTLTATTGSWSGNPAPTYTYQWQDCTSSGVNCTNITGATTSSYQTTSSDLGSLVQVAVTATNSAGNATATSNQLGPITQPASAPQNTTPPAISGQTVQGQTLTATTGSWTGNPAPTYTYQWQDCTSSGLNCTNITGATNNTYTTTSSDVGSTIQVLVTGTNSAGTATATSNQLGPITQPASAPQNTTPPSISGQTVQGQTLTATTGSWSGYPAPSYSYQWQDCTGSGVSCTNIGGATGSSYQTTSSDLGSLVQVVVTASNSAGTATATSNQLGPITPPASAPQNTTPPSISGQTVQGQTLTATTGSWSGNPAPTYTYQWQDCTSSGVNCTNITGATTSSYQTTSSDLGSLVQVAVTATNSAGNATATSNQLGPITQPASAPQNTASPAISGQTVQGQTLTATSGAWSGYPAPTYTYQWQDCTSSGLNCTNITGATNNTYTTTSSDVGSTIQVLVTGTNSAGTATATSNQLGPITQPATAPQNTTPPAISGQTTVAQTLTATTGSWTGNPAPTYTYQWQDCNSSGLNCTNITGANTSSYTTTSNDVGSTIQVLVTGTNSAGTATATSNQLGPITQPATAPQNTTPPAISGQTTVAQTLTATTGSWSGNPAPTYTYQWQDCNSSGLNCTNIAGATTSTYTTTSSDVGSTIQVVVTGSNSAGTATATSNQLGPITQPAPGPQAPILDNFNRANGAIGGNWGLVYGGFLDFTVAGNEIVDTSTKVYAWDYWKPQQLGPDVAAYVTITVPSADAVRVCGRMTNVTTSSRSGYCVQASGGSWDIRRIDKGAATSLTSTVNQPTAAGSRIGLTIVGNTITAWYSPNATSGWTQVATTTDTTYTQAGYLALESRASHLDDFAGATQ